MVKKQKKLSVKARVNRQLKLAAIPSKANDHRPHLIRRYGLLGVLILALLMQGIYVAGVRSNVLGVQAELTPLTLLDATNKERAQNGAAPLKQNAALNEAAQLKLNDMFNNQYWAHTSPSGITPWYWLEASGYQYTGAGENLAKNFATSTGVISAWIVSPTHRENVLKPEYKDVGFAIAKGELDGKQTTLIAALYGTADTSHVQGATTTDTSDIGAGLNPLTRFGLFLKELNPLTIASIILLLAATNIALIAHLSRKKLPVKLRSGWYRHHGVYKAVILVAAATLIAVSYGVGGTI